MTAKMGGGAMLAVALGIGAAVGVGGALAHDDVMPANASAATKAAYARHDNFRRLGGAFKALNDELKKPTPSKAVLVSNANAINTLAAGLPTWFPRGSGMEARPMSEAKALIWTDAAGFSAKAAALRAEAGRLSAAASGGDLDAIRAQARQTFLACKGCHETYRQEKKG